ncbi:MAG TPA: BON domain-containing protein [Gemmatimonadales bacterium]|nr:BON domain-containing protein [Gemmatimonadales bacterium]
MDRGGGMSIEMWLAEDDQVAVQSELQRKVFDELAWEPGLEALDLGVAVDDRVVTLAGTVKTYPERMAAERAACRVHGVRAVRNQIAVVLPQSEQRSDRQLARTVGWAIESDTRVPRGRIDATVTCGWVELAGEVAWPHERRAVEETVQRLVGVKGVTNLITIKPPTVPQDLRPRVQQALGRIPSLHGDHIRVDVTDTTVVLHGKVRSLSERDEAVDAAWATAGVTAVRDELEVSR